MSEREPITTELRRVMNHTTMAGVPLVEIGEYEFTHRCDAIDAVHAGLERENAELRQRVAVLDNERGNMHDGGSITDELRDWASRQVGADTPWSEVERLTAIADHIDAEHEEAIQQVLMNEGGVPATDENMAEHGWMRLPLDADGVPIRVGDVMEWVRYEDDDPTIVRNVAAVGADVFFAWSDEQGRYAQYEAHAYRHHHAPTVEDVLTKFGIDWEYESDCEDRAALLKEYAAKLRLAGDAS